MKKSAAFIFFILFILSCRIFIFEPKKNPSGSMAPTIMAGDYLLVYKWPFGHFRLAGIQFAGARNFLDDKVLERGDVITFKYPKKPSVEFVKRVVALPGDKVIYKGKKLIINGDVIQDSFEAEVDYFDRVLGTQKVRVYNESVKDKTYLIQLTATKNDPKTELRKAIIVPAGRYFVLGDNRDLSNDSRHFGFVSAAAITGKAVFIYYSYDNIRKIIRWHRIGQRVN